MYHKRIRWILYSAVLLTVFIVHTTNALDCPPGYSSSYGRCYRASPTDRNWNDAVADCAAVGGRLAAVDGQSLLENVTGLLQAVTSYSVTRFWIGLRRTRTDWRWTSVPPPNNLIQPQGCYSSGDSQFTELVGTDNNYTPPQCRQLCTTRTRLYAALVHRTDNTLECRCSNSFSADYHTVVRCTWSCPSNTNYTCGVDLSGQQINSTLVYRLVKVLSSFDGWLQGQPNNNVQDDFVPYQSCLALDLSVVSSRRYGWNDENCAESSYTHSNSVPADYGHMCGYYNINDEPTCRGYAGRFFLAGRCFSIHAESRLSWSAARQYCQQQQPASSGDLLRVDTEELLQVLTGGGGITGLVSTPTRWWIDGTNEMWMWTNGQELSSSLTTNWVSGQPIEGDRTCTAASLSGGAWRWSEEPACGGQLPYVCEADYLTTTTSTSTTTTTATTTTTTTTTTARPNPPSSTTPGPPGPPRSTSTASLLNATSPANVTSSVEPSSSTTHITAGVIIAIVFTAVVMAITTVRMLITCCDKTSREDEIRLAG